MEYRLAATIIRHDDPTVSKYGNPSLRFSLLWGLFAYENGERVENADVTEASDGNIISLDKTDKLVFTRARGFGGLALNRPSPMLEAAIIEALTDEGYVTMLLEFAKTVEKPIKSVLDLTVSKEFLKKKK